MATLWQWLHPLLRGLIGAAAQVTGGIAESLIAIASGLMVAMVGLFFYNWLNNQVRLIVHQLETIKLMLLNRRFRLPHEVHVAALKSA